MKRTTLSHLSANGTLIHLDDRQSLPSGPRIPAAMLHAVTSASSIFCLDFTSYFSLKEIQRFLFFLEIDASTLQCFHHLCMKAILALEMVQRSLYVCRVAHMYLLR